MPRWVEGLTTRVGGGDERWKGQKWGILVAAQLFPFNLPLAEGRNYCLDRWGVEPSLGTRSRQQVIIFSDFGKRWQADDISYFFIFLFS